MIGRAARKQVPVVIAYLRWWSPTPTNAELTGPRWQRQRRRCRVEVWNHLSTHVTGHRHHTATIDSHTEIDIPGCNRLYIDADPTCLWLSSDVLRVLSGCVYLRSLVTVRSF